MRHLFSLLAASMLLTACNLDLQPENGLTYTNSFDTEKELNATTTSIHVFLNNALSENYVFQTVGCLADEVHDGNQIRQWNPRSVVGAQGWKTLYDAIFTANLLLDNIGRTKGLSSERENYHRGQAHFALALSYLTLVQRFGDVPIMVDSKTIKQYASSPQMEVLALAIEHAQKAIELLPTHEKLRGINNTTISSRQFASKGNSTALLAQIYLWRAAVSQLYKLGGDAEADYSRAAEAATQIIDQKVGSYALCENPEELCEKLSKAQNDNPEAIFTLTYDLNRSVYTTSPNLVALNYCSWPVKETSTLGELTSSTNLRLYKSTVNAMYDSTDLRRGAFFYEIDSLHEVDGKDYALAYKFRNGVYDADQYSESGRSFRSLNADLVQWRLAEMYLLRAECYARLGKTAEAIADLNVVRNRAQAEPYPSERDTEGLQIAIFREREREFIYENDSRYFDIVRNQLFRTELEGKFSQLTDTDIRGGALVLPVPTSASQNTNGQVVNTAIRQKTYWVQYQ